MLAPDAVNKAVGPEAYREIEQLGLRVSQLERDVIRLPQSQLNATAAEIAALGFATTAQLALKWDIQSGTTNHLAKWTGTTAIGDSAFIDNGSDTRLVAEDLFVQYDQKIGQMFSITGSNASGNRAWWISNDSTNTIYYGYNGNLAGEQRVLTIHTQSAAIDSPQGLNYSNLTVHGNIWPGVDDPSGGTNAHNIYSLGKPASTQFGLNGSIFKIGMIREINSQDQTFAVYNKGASTTVVQKFSLETGGPTVAQAYISNLLRFNIQMPADVAPTSPTIDIFRARDTTYAYKDWTLSKDANVSHKALAIADGTIRVNYDLSPTVPDGAYTANSTIEGFRWFPQVITTGPTSGTPTLIGLQFDAASISGTWGTFYGQNVTGFGFASASSVTGYRTDLTDSFNGTSLGDIILFHGAETGSWSGSETVSSWSGVTIDTTTVTTSGKKVSANFGDDVSMLNSAYLYWGAAMTTAVGSRAGAIRMNGTTSLDLQVGTTTRVAVSSTAVSVTDDLKLTAAGNGLYVKEGSNATMGTATLSGGTATVSTTKVTANSRVHLTIQSLGTVAVPKAIGVTARTASTSFTITSADATDTSVIAWLITEPA